MTKLLLIAAAGSLGAVLRYLTHTGVQSLWPGEFPVGTLAVNVIGCLMIGFLAAQFAETTSLRPDLRLALFVGLLGSFTTFSTYGFDTLTLLENGALGLAVLNVGVSNVVGIAGVWAGLRVAGVNL